MSYLVLIRHGESEWNAKGLWTGLTDVSLSEKGKEQAKTAGDKIKKINFDFSFSSNLKRANETLEIIKQTINQNNLPTINNSALNERDYGEFTGKNKWEIKEKIGDEEFLKIRRSWDHPIKNGESLKNVYDRVVPYYLENILPKLKEEKNILIAAHGNSLRALIKRLENISDEQIPHLEISTGEVYIYNIGKNGEIISKEIKKV
ncbi:2,3-bisphosphoglycerate-dependent phosphoglycerate mutase [Candidatus Microgenomates bacterium]|nr:MAG: 2,3-bisphosphoglycerate-dependent phosphoglycerate mutase [Candidatus Microgenomates bacterium]